MKQYQKIIKHIICDNWDLALYIALFVIILFVKFGVYNNVNINNENKLSINELNDIEFVYDTILVKDEWQRELDSTNVRIFKATYIINAANNVIRECPDVYAKNDASKQKIKYQEKLDSLNKRKFELTHDDRQYSNDIYQINIYGTYYYKNQIAQ